MIILGLRTDSPVTQLQLQHGDNDVVTKEIETGRGLAIRLLEIISTFLEENGESLKSLEGLVCFAGPGSFTGLRIGHTVMNTLAYSLGLPIVQKSGEMWFQEGCSSIENGENQKVVLPEYGSEPNITKPK